MKADIGHSVDESADLKRQSDQRRGEHRGNQAHDNRAAKAKADPEEIEIINEIIEGAEGAVGKPGKAGRPKGAKTRHPAVIAIERTLRALNRKKSSWLDARSEHYYVRMLALATRLIPQSELADISPDAGDISLKLSFAGRQLVESPRGESPDAVPISPTGDNSASPDIGPPILAPTGTNPGLITADDILQAVKDGGPEADRLKALIKGELGDTLAQRADKLRARREAEESERREDMYQQHRQDMLLDDDGEHWDRWG